MDKRIEAQDYDAFGEPTPALGATVGRRARKTAIVIFWSLAALIVVGRVHYGPSIAPAAPQASLSIELASR